MIGQSIIRTMTILLLLGTPVTASALEAGDRAPLFNGASTAGEIRSSDYLGKRHVVLALYFAVFTPV